MPRPAPARSTAARAHAQEPARPRTRSRACSASTATMSDLDAGALGMTYLYHTAGRFRGSCPRGSSRGRSAVLARGCPPVDSSPPCLGLDPDQNSSALLDETDGNLWPLSGCRPVSAERFRGHPAANPGDSICYGRCGTWPATFVGGLAARSRRASFERDDVKRSDRAGGDPVQRPARSRTVAPDTCGVPVRVVYG